MTDISPGWQCNLFLEGSAGGQKSPRRLRDEWKLSSNLKDGCSGNCCSLFSKQTFICYPFSLQILERPEPQAETGSYNPSQISPLPSFVNIYSFGWWQQEACMKSDSWASIHTGLEAARRRVATSHSLIKLQLHCFFFFAIQCHLLMQLHLILYVYAFLSRGFVYSH